MTLKSIRVREDSYDKFQDILDEQFRSANASFADVVDLLLEEE